MNLLIYAALFGSLLCGAAALSADAYRRGWQKGYAKGKADEADFWIGIEKQVDREQQQMWDGGRVQRGDPDS